MKIKNKNGVLIIEPQVYSDHRGYFKETYNDSKFSVFGERKVYQANQSLSKKGVVRGLHYQQPAVCKLVWVARGSIFDVAFNLTTGEWVGETLSADNHKQLLCPVGFAHGFQALEDDTVVCYLMDGVHNPDGDYGISPLSIPWPIKEIIISDKDKKAPKWLQPS